MQLNEGDRVEVISSVMGIYNGLQGKVVLPQNCNGEVVIILDRDKDLTIGQMTTLKESQLKKIEIERPIKSEDIGKALKVIDDRLSIDSRLDRLEEILNKYNLSVKDNCGFMYIYDFLDTLSENLNTISKEDKEEIIFCLVGEK